MCLGCLRVIFSDKCLKNAFCLLETEETKACVFEVFPQPLQRELEVGVDLCEWAPSARGPIFSHHWHFPSEGLGFPNKHPIWTLFAKSCLDFQVYFLKPLHYFSHLMLNMEGKYHLYPENH